MTTHLSGSSKFAASQVTMQSQKIRQFVEDEYGNVKDYKQHMLEIVPFAARQAETPEEIQKQASLSILLFKIQKHKSKIEYIFKDNAEEKPKALSPEDVNEPKKESDGEISIAKLDNIFRDISLTCGFVFCSFEEF